MLRTSLLAALAASAFACLAHAAPFVPNRDASLFDGSVDVLGTLAGCWVYFKRMKNEG